MPINQQILLDNRPQGEAVASNFKLVSAETPALADGQVMPLVAGPCTGVQRFHFNSCQRFICKRQRPKILEVLICTTSLQSVETDLSWLMLRPSTGKRLTYLNVPVAWLQMRPAASYTEPSVKASVAVR